mmetsp:Transcript_60985/g.101385  ORF Transcript_60985/g.101385 Transcript_60985/m.101385 type:complete len:350 (+) Transcript_60985:104-1153(+)
MAPFLTKLFQIVSASNTDSCIQWTTKGDSFVISDPDTFARDILPTYFKHNNIRSFIRQLNTYGFRKRTNISSTDEHLEFFHEKFRRDQASMLMQIKRCHQPKALSRPAGADENVTSGETDKPSPDMDIIRNRVGELKSKLGALQSEIREYNSQLEQKVNMLMQIIQTATPTHSSMQIPTQPLAQPQTAQQQHQQPGQQGQGQQQGQQPAAGQAQPGINGQHQNVTSSTMDILNRRDALFASLGDQTALSGSLSGVTGLAGLGLSGLGGGLGHIGGVNAGLTGGLMGSLGGLGSLTSGVPKSGEVAGLQHLLEAAQRYHTVEDTKSSDASMPLSKRFRAELGPQEEVAHS